MKDCAEYREMISQMADGELTEPHKTELARHIASCPDCRRLYDAFAFISSSLAEGMAEPPETLRTGISGELRTRKAQKAAARRRRRRAAAFTALAACAALVVVVAARGGVPSIASGAAVRSDTQAAETAEGTPADDSQEDTVRTEDADVLPDTGGSTVTGCIRQPEEASVPSSDQNTLTTGGEESTYSGEIGQENLVSLPSGQTSGAAEEDATKVSMVRLFAGAVQPTKDTAPELTVTDETSVAFLMDLLACSETSKADAVTGDPTFTLAVTAEDGDYVVSVWIADGRLYCRSDRDGVLYVAAGSADDLIDFVAGA